MQRWHIVICILCFSLLIGLAVLSVIYDVDVDNNQMWPAIFFAVMRFK